jgi:hypothetical protein
MKNQLEEEDAQVVVSMTQCWVCKCKWSCKHVQEGFTPILTLFVRYFRVLHLHGVHVFKKKIHLHNVMYIFFWSFNV